MNENISNDILNTKMELLKKEEAILEKEIKKNTQLEYSNQVSKETVLNFIRQFVEELPQDDYIRNRMLVNTFIDEILVFKDSLIITFKISVSELTGDNVKLKSFDFILPPISFDVCINRISRNYIRK